VINRLSVLGLSAVALAFSPTRAPAQAFDLAPVSEDTSHSRIVLAISAAGAIVINNQPVPTEDLPRELGLIFAGRPHRVLLVWLPDAPQAAAVELLVREAEDKHITLYRTRAQPFPI
jgi:biopolymer transport protein ExbD